MTKITNANLDWNDSGTPVSEHFDDVYFSNVSGLEETRYVFLQQNHLPERWHSYEYRRFVIAETGFGTGLNFLAVWQWFEKFRAENPESPLKELHFISFEKYPLTKEDLIKAHSAWPEFSAYAKELQETYPIALPECQRLSLAGGMITLDLWFGDIQESLPKVPVYDSGLVDCWFLDGFAPSKNPDMWQQQLFNGMASLAKENCSCATFTAAGFVRRGLIEAGFEMKKVKGFGTKREMIAGTLTNKIPAGNIPPWYNRQPSDSCEDIAIIGGGIASAVLADKLLQRGKKVTLYCKDSQPAENASGNRQGAIYPLLNGTHTGVSRLFAPAFLYAREYITQLSRQIEFDHDWCGVTQLMWNDKSEKKLTSMLEGNFPDQLAHKLSVEETSQHIGLPVDVESISYPLGGWLSPKQLTTNLLTHLQNNNNFKLCYQTEITALEPIEQDGSWLLKSENQQFHHASAVIANGHLFRQFGQAKEIAATPVKGQVSHIPTTKQLSKLKTVLCYNGYMTPNNPTDNLHCIGASHDRVNINQEFEAGIQSENRFKLIRSLPNQSWPEEVDISGNMARQGIRCVTRDHLPYVGNVGDYEQILSQYANLRSEQSGAQPVASYPNLFCLLALGSRGLCSAPLMAELLASQICNDPLPLPTDVLESVHPAKMWVRKLLKGKPVSTLTTGC
ncbi:bifunctional tRNA (5-methylaminomethyl-2-thiouridine)(34)-methyltransferase MnmD/FAD-dependent 5-carboxymethylaminomethyl-2-thiouridine(34) oxidoreductase MnmC [Vibrio sp. SCSIO 43137]|uniref:bifunctional tRNA (5-methylaminomethyl-2-thiouridine)(34)-methyltransferase MnmD/FAD-dependent 5-carboxymethylaminomethyl-2-thiouridine(34) oxidoreductase MnmC n=1 Tax=Vibrio sp. SCSIO 43137 TaxID=3021011 RepID=UPI0023075902|nr:bifunctional tRNA (5-methylaminomethyl-2-thiouridine)(34)-methyltransferase MnmD/FAD-dependent 5-carboxymethylaminomethyl-2-thiouridine(34) oxidoreductase MnmC [Vibrio sp. SCSIO 43137]WCE28932.1 bifunctional tRNA (5-methylaminomethyl-2-thiouridine)(34)-methyltransferase MnmD/FAD-dependent 5-carboxymethylaminomethyl-2-thiouridine(34) oxidoreductase MnmC [Vibrio sp. SCSIO 43137]